MIVDYNAMQLLRGWLLITMPIIKRLIVDSNPNIKRLIVDSMAYYHEVDCWLRYCEFDWLIAGDCAGPDPRDIVYHEVQEEEDTSHPQVGHSKHNINGIVLRDLLTSP